MGTIITQDEVPHILMFPLPIQSPVNSMLKLAELFCLAGFQVTFVNTQHNQKLLSRSTDIESRFAKYSGSCTFRPIPDGLPDDHPRTADLFGEMFTSLQKSAKSFFSDEMIRSLSSKVACFVADGLFYYALGIAKDIGTPLMYFDTISACCLWTYLCIPQLIHGGEVPIKGNDLNALVKSVPDMEHFLRLRDLPSFFRGNDLLDENLHFVMKEIKTIPQSQGFILNTFEGLDSLILSRIRTQVPNVYAVGPVHKHLETRLASQNYPSSASSNSFIEEDKSCLKWLDRQLNGSVLYVSFGSLTMLSEEEFMEFWHGVSNSGTKFLWVMRPNSITGGNLEKEFGKNMILEGMNSDQGYFVNWAPQERVLTHSAIGGFLTHSGWNSTLESIVAGVPMICWPHYVDQNVTSRFVSEVWRFGLDMKDSCDRKVIEEIVRNLMSKGSHEFKKSTKVMSKLALESISEGGSSYCDLERLLDDIKLLTCQKSVDGLHRDA